MKAKTRSSISEQRLNPLGVEEVQRLLELGKLLFPLLTEAEIGHLNERNNIESAQEAEVDLESEFNLAAIGNAGVS